MPRGLASRLNGHTKTRRRPHPLLEQTPGSACVMPCRLAAGRVRRTFLRMQKQSAFEGKVERARATLDIEATNLLQMELIELSGQDPETWILQYSVAFRDAITEESDYFAQLYHTDHEACLEILKEKIDTHVLH